MASKPFSTFKVLSFDIYGTLIDWESGILDALAPLTSTTKTTRVDLAKRFNAIEARLQHENPQLEYYKLLELAYKEIAKDLGVAPQLAADGAVAFGQSIGDWNEYADTVKAMQSLARHYKLIALSNVDRASFSRTCSRHLPGVNFDAVYTAQDIGSYKPSLNNFRYLLDHAKQEFDVDKPEILHVAHSLFHDHVPAKDMGMYSVWISREDRESGMMGDAESLRQDDKVNFGWQFETLGDFADSVEKEFAQGK